MSAIAGIIQRLRVYGYTRTPTVGLRMDIKVRILVKAWYLKVYRFEQQFTMLDELVLCKA